MPPASYTELAAGALLRGIEVRSDSVNFSFVLGRRGWDMSLEFFINFRLTNSLIGDEEHEFDVSERSGEMNHLWRLVGLQIGRLDFQSDAVTLELASERLNNPFVRAHPSMDLGFPEQVIFRIDQESVFHSAP